MLMLPAPLLSPIQAATCMQQNACTHTHARQVCLSKVAVSLPAFGTEGQEGLGAFQEAGAGSKGAKSVLADLKGGTKPMVCLLLFLRCTNPYKQCITVHHLCTLWNCCQYMPPMPEVHVQLEHLGLRLQPLGFSRDRARHLAWNGSTSTSAVMLELRP